LRKAPKRLLLTDLWGREKKFEREGETRVLGGPKAGGVSSLREGVPAKRNGSFREAIAKTIPSPRIVQRGKGSARC